MTDKKRADQSGTHRRQFEQNKKIIYRTQDTCGICGTPVNKKLRYPNPLSPCIDHIIPIAKGGHPSDIENLQLAHWTCNRQKSDKVLAARAGGHENKSKERLTNRNLPQINDWMNYQSKK